MDQTLSVRSKYYEVKMLRSSKVVIKALMCILFVQLTPLLSLPWSWDGWGIGLCRLCRAFLTHDCWTIMFARDCHALICNYHSFMLFQKDPMIEIFLLWFWSMLPNIGMLTIFFFFSCPTSIDKNNKKCWHQFCIQIKNNNQKANITRA